MAYHAPGCGRGGSFARFHYGHTLLSSFPRFNGSGGRWRRDERATAAVMADFLWLRRLTRPHNLGRGFFFHPWLSCAMTGMKKGKQRADPRRYSKNGSWIINAGNCYFPLMLYSNLTILSPDDTSFLEREVFLILWCIVLLALRRCCPAGTKRSGIKNHLHRCWWPPIRLLSEGGRRAPIGSVSVEASGAFGPGRTCYGGALVMSGRFLHQEMLAEFAGLGDP